MGYRLTGVSNGAASNRVRYLRGVATGALLSYMAISIVGAIVVKWRFPDYTAFVWISALPLAVSLAALIAAQIMKRRQSRRER